MSNRLLAGRYELLEKIGDGGMAVVYKAKDRLLNRFIAIKILRPEFTKDATFVENFKRESQAAAGLSHPNIVGVYDVGKEGNINYIVMELVNGRTLNEIIDEQAPMDYRAVIDITKQVASALKVAHTNKIIHRDVKPHNIMITPDGIVKLADFGIAKAVNDATLSTGSKVIGSVHYFSPEQARGNYVDERSDIYSLGIVMYEMLTGQVPFDGDNPVTIALKHINEEITPPSELVGGIPPQLERCVLKATNKFQTNRYNSAAELIEELDNIEFVTKVVGNTAFINAAESIERNKKSDDAVNDEAEQAEENESGSKKKTGIIVTSVILALAILAGLAYWFLLREEEPVDLTVQVPNLSDLTLEQASQRVSELNLKVVEGEAVCSSEIAEGRIAEQDPKEGTKVDPESTIIVKLSKGPKEGEIPSVIGMTEGEAKAKLTEAGYKLGTVRIETSTEDAGKILNQDPAPGVVMERGYEVTIWVSDGKGVEVGIVPSVINMTHEEAKDAFKDAGFDIGRVKYEESEIVAKGYVLWQQYEAGDELKVGTKIDIEISKGAPQANDDPGGGNAGSGDNNGEGSDAPGTDENPEG